VDPGLDSRSPPFVVQVFIVQIIVLEVFVIQILVVQIIVLEVFVIQIPVVNVSIVEIFVFDIIVEKVAGVASRHCESPEWWGARQVNVQSALRTDDTSRAAREMWSVERPVLACASCAVACSQPAPGPVAPSRPFPWTFLDMTQDAASRMPHHHVEARRSRILAGLGRPAAPLVAAVSLPVERVQHLVREAEELYWNELAWEELTEEEKVSGGHLTELVFPGLLSFVDALLLDSYIGSQGSGPHPEVVEEILAFLAERYDRVTEDLGRGADSENLVWARALTAHVIDLILYRLYGVTHDEREELEARA